MTVNVAAPFRHILVTLDGSSLSEVALPVAAELARIAKAPLTLLHVVELDAPATIHGDRHLQTAEEAQGYLDVLVETLAQSDISATAMVYVSEPTRGVDETIASVTASLGSDLTVLASHGEGGMREQLFGRVAQRVIRRSPGPLVVVPATRGNRPFELDVMTLPLDGSSDAEIVLPVASELSRRAGSRVVLLRVVPTPGDLQGSEAAVRTLLPSATATVLRFEVDDAGAYLREIASTWFPERTCTIDVRRGPVEEEIRQAVEAHETDLLVMCTHGRSGLSALLEGSLGAHLLNTTPCPILLFRFQK